jgi:Ca2+-binding RTX toxin-like protein
MAVTTQMRTQVTQLYVSLFGRAPEASGLGYWVQQLGEGKSLQTIAQDMFNVAPSRVYYPSYLTNEEIVAKFYVNVLGRTADAGGLAYWTGRLNTESTTGTAASRANAVGTVVTEMLQAVVNTPADSPNAQALASQSLLNNKVAVGLHYAVDLNGNDVAFASTLMPLVTTGPNGADLALSTIDGTQSYTLTNSIDKASANIFTAKPVYTPGGNDFINSLQDEDSLTGVGANPTLNAVLGQANDLAEGMISPILTNIQTVNVEVTGTTGIDFQDATGVKNLNINRITATNAATKMTDLDKSTTDISVSNATRGGTVEFLYKEDNLLATDNTLNVGLSNTRLSVLTIGETGDDAGEDKGYGFETVNVTVAQSSNIDNFTIGSNVREDVAGTTAAPANQTVNITANATTEINNLQAVGAEFINLVANAEVMIAADERNILQASNDGINTNDLRKLVITGAANVTIDGLNGHIDEKLTINGDVGTTLVVDASAMTGNLKLGVQAAADANNSGTYANRTDKDVSITSGSGNDIIETYTALAGDISTGAGDDSVLINNGATTAVWTNVEGVSTINTGAGKDLVRAADLLATADDVLAGNTTFGEVTAASVVTGEGDDTVTVANLSNNKDWNNGVLTDSNVDDTYFVKGASISTGAGADVITVATVAEGAMVDAGADNDTLKIDINGGTILAGDDTVKNGAATPVFREVALDGSVDVLGAIVEMGDGDDTITIADAVSLTTAATTIVGTDAELRAGAGNDVLNVTALDAVSVTSATDAATKDTNVNITGVETANFTVANQIDLGTATATGATENDNVETDGAITADVMRFDTALAAINLVSQEVAMLQDASTEIYEAGQATAFTLNNFRDGIALTLKANEATGVSAGKLKDDEAVDVNLTVNNAAARGHAEGFTLNIAEGSGAFDLNLNLNATATDTVGNAASKTDDDDMRVENVTVKLAADDQGHYINFNNFGDAVHSDAVSEGSKVVNTSLTVTGGTAGTTLVLDNVSTDSVNATGAANVKLKTVGSNNYVINTGSGNDVINMFGDDVRANDLSDDPADADSVDTIDEADAINAGSGNDRMIINGSDNLGNFAALGGLTDDDVFNKIKSVESIEVQGGGANTIIIDEAAATTGTNLQNIYFTGAGAQTTTVQIGNNFVNNNGTVANTLNLDSTTSFTTDKGAAAKSGALVLTIDNQDTDQDQDLINLNVMVGMEKGTDVNFFNTGDSKATVNITAVVAANSANTVGKSIGAANGNLSLEVGIFSIGSIDKVTLLDSADAADTNDNGQITVTVDNSWSKSTLEFDASAIMNDDEAGMDLAIEEIEGSGDPAVTQVAGIQAGDTGGLVFNGAGELDAKLIVRGTQNDDDITGSSQDDTLDGNAGDDIIVGGLGADAISGGAGNDLLVGGVGKDSISGGDGDDFINGGLGADALDGGDGEDTFYYTSVTESNGGDADVITGFVSADDTIEINGVVAGSAGQDFINLASFKEVSTAGDGDNSLAGNTGAGNAVLGDAYYAADSGQLVIDVDGNGDITTGADIVIKSAGKITAADINYTITAGAGNDFIRGGQGSDDLNGGAGNDTFVLLGSLSEADASAYAAAYQAGGSVPAAVLGATLAAVDTKMIAASELMSSRTATEVNAGDKINSAGADATDTIHAFGTADLSNINAGAALNVGTLVVHSAVTLTYAQVTALNAIVFDGNMPHAVTLKNDASTGADTVAALLAKTFFLAAGAATTITLTAPDGVLKAAWDPVDMRMEVVADSRVVGGAAAGTPLQGLGGAKNLSDKTYASAAIQYAMGLTGYEIVDAAATIAAGTTPVLNAAVSVALTAGAANAADLNTIDGKTTNLVNATAVSLLTGTAFELNNALDDQSTIDTAANVAVQLSGAVGSVQVEAGLLNAINANTTGMVNATAAGMVYGTAADVLNSMDSPAEMTVNPDVFTIIYDAQAAAADLNAIDALTTTTVNANNYVGTITGTSADVWNAMDDQNTIDTGAYVNVKLSGLVAAADVLGIAGNTGGSIYATTGVTGFTGSANNLSNMFGLGNLSYSYTAPVTVTGTTAQAADLVNIENHSGVTVNALAVTEIFGTATEVMNAIDNQADTDTRPDVNVFLVNDGNGIATTLNAIDTATTGLVNATLYTTITGTAADVLNAVDNQAQMATATNVALTLSAGTTTAAVLNSLDFATNGLVNAVAITAITGTAADAKNAIDNQATMQTNANLLVTVAAGVAAAADLNAIDLATNGLVNATAVTEITGSVAAVIDATNDQAQLSTAGAVLVTLDAAAGVAATDLNTIDGVTTGLVNATAITSITGLAADVWNAVDVQTTMSTAANVAVTVSAGVVPAATLNSIDGATTGLVNATAVTTVTGSIAAVTDALNDQAAMSTAAAVLVTLDDVAATATALNALDALTSGVITATTVGTVTGAIADVTTAFQSAGIAFAVTADATVTGTSTITQLNALNATGVDVITFGTAFATTTTDVIDLTAAGFDAGAHTIKYTAGNQTVAFNFTDLGVAGFDNGDTFTQAGAADVIRFDANDILDLTAFGLGSLNAATALYTGTNEKVGDGEWTMVRGTWAAGTFTVAAAGADTLVLWDSNAAGVAVTQSAVVITGVPSLTFGSTILV